MPALLSTEFKSESLRLGSEILLIFQSLLCSKVENQGLGIWSISGSPGDFFFVGIRGLYNLGGESLFLDMNFHRKELKS